LPQDKSFPAQLEKALRAEGANVRVINAGVSGDVAAEGLARLDWSLGEKVDAVIVELGANDALRGLPPAATEKALGQILTKLNARGLPVLLAGMEAPRNWGPDYVTAFRAIYPRLAAKYDAILFPFFLKDVVGKPELNQQDGLHPTAEGVAIVVHNILPQVNELIARAKARPQIAG
jgi:acyl-CoA thioesterase-1